MIRSLYFVVLLAIPICATIQAPYLISLTNQATVAGSFVSLTWRNNDIATNGFLVYRSQTNPPGPGDLIKTASKEKTSIIDSTAAPKTRYFYSIRGFAENDTSIQSNCDSITTSEILKQNNSRIIDCDWYPDSQYIGLSFVDNCNYEDGYIIKTAKDTNDYVEYNYQKSVNPGKLGDTSFAKIRNLEHNTWYRVTLGVVNKGVDTSWFQPCTLFTLKAQELLDSEPVVYLSSLLSEFPLESNMWSTKIGDDFASGEKNGISIINISNPSSPQFKKILAPPAFNGKIAPIKDDLLMLNSGTNFKLCKFYQDSTDYCKVIDSFVISGFDFDEVDETYFFNDSLLVLSEENFYTTRATMKSYDLLKVYEDHIIHIMGFNGLVVRDSKGLIIGVYAIYNVVKEFICKGVLYVNDDYRQISYIADCTKMKRMVSYQRGVVNEINLLSASKDVAPKNRVDGIRVSGDLTGVKKLFINKKDSLVYLVRTDKLSIYKYSSQPINAIKNVQKNAACRKICYLQGHNLIIDKGKSDIPEIAILNIAGKKLSSIKPLGSTIDLSKSVQAPGLYFIAVKTKSGMYSLPYLLQ